MGAVHRAWDTRAWTASAAFRAVMRASAVKHVTVIGKPALVVAAGAWTGA